MRRKPNTQDGTSLLEAAGVISLLLPVLFGMLGLADFMWTSQSLRSLQREELQKAETGGVFAENAVQGILIKSAFSCKANKNETAKAVHESFDAVADRMEERVKRLMRCEGASCPWNYDIHIFAVSAVVDTANGHIIGIQHPECLRRKSEGGPSRTNWSSFRYRSNRRSADALGQNYAALRDHLDEHVSTASRGDELGIPTALYGFTGDREFSNPDGPRNTEHFLRYAPLFLSRIQIENTSSNTPLSWLNAIMNPGKGSGVRMGVTVDILPIADFARRPG